MHDNQLSIRLAIQYEVAKRVDRHRIRVLKIQSNLGICRDIGCYRRAQEYGAYRGHVAMVRALVRTDIDVDHVNNLGWTALLEAVILGEGGPPHQEIVRALVAAGADVDLADRDGVTPLAHARERGYAEIARTLEAAGAR